MELNLLNRHLLIPENRLTASQLRIDFIAKTFQHEASNFQNITAMTFGSGIFRFSRLGTLKITEKFPFFAANIFSYASSLSAEVIAFRSTHSFFDKIAGKTNSEPVFGEGFIRTFTDFLSLKVAGQISLGHGILIQHGLQSSAMVASRHLNAEFGFLPQPQDSLLAQLIEAETCNLALGLGSTLFKTLSGSHLRHLESQLEISQQVQILKRRSYLPTSSLNIPYWAAQAEANKLADIIRYIEFCIEQGTSITKARSFFERRYGQLNSQERVELAKYLYLYEKNDTKVIYDFKLEILQLLSPSELRAHAINVYQIGKRNFMARVQKEEERETRDIQSEHLLLRHIEDLFEAWKYGKETSNWGEALSAELIALDPIAQTLYLTFHAQLMREILGMPAEAQQRAYSPFFLEYYLDNAGTYNIRKMSWGNQAPQDANPLYLIRGEFHPATLILLSFDHLISERETALPADVKLHRTMMTRMMRLFHGLPLLGFSSGKTSTIVSTRELFPKLLEDLRQGKSIIWGVDPATGNRDILLLMELLVLAIKGRVSIRVAIDLSQECNGILKDYNSRMQPMNQFVAQGKIPLPPPRVLENAELSGNIEKSVENERPLSALTKQVLRVLQKDIAHLADIFETPTPLLNNLHVASGLPSLFEVIFAAGFFPLHFIGPPKSYFGLDETNAEGSMANFHHRVDALRNLGDGATLVVTLTSRAHQGGFGSLLPMKSVKTDIWDTPFGKPSHMPSFFVRYPHRSGFDYILHENEEAQP